MVPTYLRYTVCSILQNLVWCSLFIMLSYIVPWQGWPQEMVYLRQISSVQSVWKFIYKAIYTLSSLNPSWRDSPILVCNLRPLPYLLVKKPKSYGPFCKNLISVNEDGVLPYSRLELEFTISATEMVSVPCPGLNPDSPDSGYWLQLEMHGLSLERVSLWLLASTVVLLWVILLHACRGKETWFIWMRHCPLHSESAPVSL